LHVFFVLLQVIDLWMAHEHLWRWDPKEEDGLGAVLDALLSAVLHVSQDD
jgi:hypothetical protein